MEYTDGIYKQYTDYCKEKNITNIKPKEEFIDYILGIVTKLVLATYKSGNLVMLAIKYYDDICISVGVTEKEELFVVISNEEEMKNNVQKYKLKESDPTDVF